MRMHHVPGYDIAQICRNGHVVNSSTQRQSAHCEKFCAGCGSETITACPKCDTPIRGMYWGGLTQYYSRPAHCSSCGKPFPWTQAALTAASEYAAEVRLEVEQSEFADIIENLVKDTPSTPLAASRFGQIMSKATPVAVEGFKAILVNVVTEAAKKAMFPPGS
jgi:hypothetical protein